MTDEKKEQLFEQIPEEVAETLRGSIDSFDTGTVKGWAVANENDRYLNLHVICNEKIESAKNRSVEGRESHKKHSTGND